MMTTSAPGKEISDAEYLARAQMHVPKLRDQSEATNASGRVQRETIDAWRDDGLFTLLQPKRFGGSERGLVRFSIAPSPSRRDAARRVGCSQ